MLMDLFIETLTGVSFELRVSPAETIMSIKSKIQRTEGIPVAQQHLILHNDELDDHRRIRDYAISGGSTIRLVLGMRGGPLNAHRVPPMRLTPIQLAPSTPPSMLSKLSRSATSQDRFAYLSRLTLPLVPTNNTTANPATSESISKSVADALSTRPTTILLSESSQRASNTSQMRCTKSPRDNFNDDNNNRLGDVDSSRSSIPSQCPQSLLEPFSNRMWKKISPILQTTSSAGDNEFHQVDVPNSISPGPIDHALLLMDDHTVHSESSTSIATNGDRKLQDPSSEKSEQLQHPPASAPCQADSDYSQPASTTCDPFTTYPPLLNPSGTLRSYVNSCDISPYWRIYESHRIVTLPTSLLARAATNAFPLVGTEESDNENLTTAAANQTNSTSSKQSHDDAVGSDYAAAAALLSGLINSSAMATTSSSNDPLGIPYQTSGSERLYNGNWRYPYHWLRRATPLFSESELSRSVLTAAGFWDGDETLDEGASNTLGVTPEADEDDVDGDDEDDEDGEDEDGDDVTKTCFGFGLDDDDSLADLEDYLLYYRSGDLLFGPPSLTTIYPPSAPPPPPYSFFTLRDSIEMDADASEFLSGTHSSRVDGQRKDSAKWMQECNQLANKVNDLKERMNKLKVRRQSRRRSQAGEGEKARIDPLKESANPGEAQKCEAPSVQEGDGKSTSAVVGNDATDASTPVAMAISSRTPNSRVGDRQRRRRFGTVIAPELSALVPPSPDDTDLLTHPISSGIKSSDTIITSPLTPSPSRRPLSSVVRSMDSLPALPRVDLVQLRKSSTPVSLTPEHGVKPLLTQSTSGLGTIADLARPRTSVLPVSSPMLLPELKGPIPCPMRATQLFSRNDSRRSTRPPSSRTPEAHKLDTPILPALTGGVYGKGDMITIPRTPPKTLHSPTSSVRRKRCALCLRKTGIASNYPCRCGRNFCSRHRYAEVHACAFDYKAEARRTLIDSNPVVNAPKLPKI